MPLAAVLIVLLSIALMFIYGVPAVRGRLSDSAQNLVVSQAAATAEAVSGAQGGPVLGDELKLATEPTGGEAIVVDRRAGCRPVGAPSTASSPHRRWSRRPRAAPG
jgi:hypothetical protein